MLAGMDGTYTCDLCGQTYEKAWTDEEALAEAEDNFSPAELEDTAVVCDDCYRKFMPELPRTRAEIDQEAAAAGMSYDEYIRSAADPPLSARDEVRVSEYGLLRCPSCEASAAEILMTDHCLILINVPLSQETRATLGPELLEHITEEIDAECRDGRRVPCRDWDTMEAATNIALADDVNFREKQHYRWLYYSQPGR
jgi:hypothetical protein